MSIFLLALIAAIVSFILGWVWHGPLFGKIWGGAIGMMGSEMSSTKKKMTISLILQFVVTYIMALMVFLLLANFGAATIGEALITALVLFVGFVIPFEAMGVLWNGRSTKSQWKIFLISTGFQLVSFAIWALLFIWLM